MIFLSYWEANDPRIFSRCVFQKFLRFIQFAVLFLFMNGVFAQNFVYKEDETKSIALDKVKFHNGFTVKIVSDGAGSKNLGVFDSKKRPDHSQGSISGDLINIVGAYPNDKNATVAIITTGSSGTCCNWSDYYLAYISSSKLYIHKISSSFKHNLKIDVNILKGVLVDAEASNVSEKYDGSGAEIRKLVLKKGFVKTGFKNKFLDLVGVHPTIFFQHKIHRETLKNVIGINIFDRTSSYMDVSGESTIENGQYIVFDGMAPHSAGFQSCALVIDAVNEGYWFFCLDIAENENFFSGATTNWNEEVARIVWEGLQRRVDWIKPKKLNVFDEIFKLTRIDCINCPEMVMIPMGSFLMGSAPDPFNERIEPPKAEFPQHQVQIKSFAIGKYEVTQEQYYAVMGVNPSRFKGRSLPVEQVSWDDAQEFVKKLSAKTGKNYRLPTEAEWEYAARARSTTDFSFGNDVEQLAEYAWYDNKTDGKTHSVGLKKPNAFGLYDMHGNIWEWTQDCWNTSYVGAPTVGSTWLRGNCSLRVIRGGSWPDHFLNLRSATRGSSPSHLSNIYIGFRVARDN